MGGEDRSSSETADRSCRYKWRALHAKNNLYGKKNKLKKQNNLVDGIAYSSGLGGRIESCLSVLDSEQQGLSGDGLKNALILIIRPAQPREY